MKLFKFFSIAAVAALLLAPASAMAKTHFNFSLNISALAPMIAQRPPMGPPPPPVYYVAVPRPYYKTRTVVKEVHHYYQVPVEVPIDISPNCRHCY